jgi:hypothetical protein
MPVAYRSHSTAGFVNSSTNLAFTYPSGLAVGDLMTLIIGLMGTSAGSVGNVTDPINWTPIFNAPYTTDQDRRLVAYQKIADAADVLAGGLTVIPSNTSFTAWAGAIVRADGFDTVTPIGASNHAEVAGISGTTPSFACTITPLANSLILYPIISCDGLSNYSSPAIATDNPTWNNLFELDTTLGVDGTFVLNYAIRSQATPTGNASTTDSNSFADRTAALIAVSPAATPVVNSSHPTLLLMGVG